MKQLGIFLLLMGVGSAVLHFMDMEFKLLMWIGNWGDTVAWVIRGALAVAGGALLGLSLRQPAAKPAE